MIKKSPGRPKKSSDNEIIKTLKKHSALTEAELEKILGYGNHCLNSRLKKLAKKRLLRHKRVMGNRGRYKFFQGYNGITIYYVDKKHLKEWIEEKLPNDMSPDMKWATSKKIYRNFKVRR